MLGRSAPASASATAASLVLVVLAVAGCKIQVPSAAQASAGTTGTVQAGTSGVTRAGSLAIEPGAGFSSAYNLVNGAKHSIDVTMYEFSDTTAGRDPHQLLQLPCRLLYPREGHRGRLRHSPRQGIHRIGELLQYLPQRQPRARADHLQPCRHVRDRRHLRLGLPERPALVVAGMAGLQRYSPAPEGSDYDDQIGSF
jgi:hypothetical protein